MIASRASRQLSSYASAAYRAAALRPRGTDPHPQFCEMAENRYHRANVSSAAPVVMPKEYIIYCDESASIGTTFSHFYGGALIRSNQIDKVRKLIADKKADLHLLGEIKWQKVT